MTRTSKQKVIDLRNAIFEAADGLTIDEMMQGTTMAQAKLLAATLCGDEAEAGNVLQKYRRIQSDAMSIYCAEELSAAH